jgi:hypothetical protein
MIPLEPDLHRFHKGHHAMTICSIFLIKQRGWVFVLGLGYLLLQRVPGGTWIAVVFTVVGGMIKLLFRIL